MSNPTEPLDFDAILKNLQLILSDIERDANYILKIKAQIDLYSLEHDERITVRHDDPKVQ